MRDVQNEDSPVACALGFLLEIITFDRDIVHSIGPRDFGVIALANYDFTVLDIAVGESQEVW